AGQRHALGAAAMILEQAHECALESVAFIARFAAASHCRTLRQILPSRHCAIAGPIATTGLLSVNQANPSGCERMSSASQPELASCSPQWLNRSAASLIAVCHVAGRTPGGHSVSRASHAAWNLSGT